MALFFDVRFWIACAILALLAFTHTFAYKAGRSVVANDWATERADRANDLVELSRAHRATEQALNQKANNVDKKLQLKKKSAAAAADAAAGELQLLQAALAAASGAAVDSTSPSGADGASEGGLLLACATKHQGMAAEADATAVKLTSLQSYVSDVCLSAKAVPSGESNNGR